MFDFDTKENSFLKAKRKGKQGETAVKDYYLNNGSSVIDVSEDREYQKIDVDFIIDGNFVEVKTQKSLAEQEKITLEIETEYYNNLVRQGWFYSTEANILIFYDNTNNIAYSVDTKELRNLYEKYKNTKEIDKYMFDEERKVSTLVYIPIDLLKKQLNSLEILKY